LFCVSVVGEDTDRQRDRRKAVIVIVFFNRTSHVFVAWGTVRYGTV
jgi:hypothetical protein